jgi:hypothetical protein
MTDKEAKYLLNKHTLYFNIVINNRENIRNPEALNDIEAVIKHYEPFYAFDWGCKDCVFKTIEKANQIRLSLNATYPDDLKPYNFPKQ